MRARERWVKVVERRGRGQGPVSWRPTTVK